MTVEPMHLPFPVTRVGAHMTGVPRCVSADDSLAVAAEVMRDYGMRHVPVLEAGRPVGVVGERDLLIAENLAPNAWRQNRVFDAMVGIPYCTSKDATVSEVAQHMALRGLDVALVMSGGRIRGLFSTANALALLADLAGRIVAGPGLLSDPGSSMSA